MWRVKSKKVIVLASCLVAVASVFASLVFTLKLSLERHIIPAYPANYASLRDILDYYQKELAKQGMDVQIRVLDESGCDEPRDVRGAAGNGYLFLFVLSNTFDTQFECGVWRTITIAGVGSKERKNGSKPPMNGAVR
jgi:hypothetical protein